MPDFVPRPGNADRGVARKDLGDRGRIAVAGRHPPIQFRQLQSPDRGLHLGHAHIRAEGRVHPAEAGAVLLVEHRVVVLAVILDRPGPAPQVVVAGDQHAALAAGRHDLVLAEGERRHVADPADRPPVPGGAVRLGAVFDHDEVVLGRQRHETVHVAGPPRMVNRDHGPGSRRQHRFDGLRSDVLRLRADVGENRRAAEAHDAARRGDEGPRGYHDLVARPDARGFQREFQCYRAVSERDGVAGITILCEFRLECPAVIAGPLVDPPAPQHGFDGLEFVFGKDRPT